MLRRRRFLEAGASLLAGAARAQPLSGRELYATLRSEPGTSIEVDGGRLQLVLQGSPGPDWERRVRRWLDRAIAAISSYLGRFPVERAGLLVRAQPGRGVRGGVSYGIGSSAVKVDVGTDSSDDDLDHDWVLTHEFVHLGFPDLPRRHLWLQEGSATYVEPIARIQAGQMPAEEMWRDLRRGLPKGLPAPGDEGLDRTHTWGRTYWGGALFCCLADLRTRRATAGRHGLQAAMRAINRESGGNVPMWSIEQVIATGDHATGTTVLADLYREMATTPVAVDLDALFASLGVAVDGDRLVLDDAAPEAAIRRAITAR